MNISTRHLLALGCLFLLSFSIQAQSNTKQWKSANPTVLLIEESDVTPDLLKSLEDNKSSYIIYTNELKQSDIENFEASLKDNSEQLRMRESEAEVIKIWFGEHPDVKIIKRSDYNNLNDDKKAIYEGEHALILETDVITLQDIENYN
jgi:hypothetical protein